MSTTKRFARVENGNILESHVSAIHIKNRRHNQAMYHEVIEQEKPAVTQFQYHKEVLTVVGKVVHANYVVVDKTADMILGELHRVEGSTGPEAEKPNLYLNEVDPVVVSHVLGLVKLHVTEKLDKFAQEREYDGIVSLTTYATSAQEKFRVEGQRGVDLRDETYAALHMYLGQMMTGQAYVPKSLREVDSILPALTWAN